MGWFVTHKFPQNGIFNFPTLSYQWSEHHNADLFKQADFLLLLFLIDSTTMTFVGRGKRSPSTTARLIWHRLKDRQPKRKGQKYLYLVLGSGSLQHWVQLSVLFQTVGRAWGRACLLWRITARSQEFPNLLQRVALRQFNEMIYIKHLVSSTQWALHTCSLLFFVEI